MGSTKENRADFYVSPAGNDAWSGTLEGPNADRTDGPFLTPFKARDAVGELKASGGETDIVVLFRGGRYYLDKTFVLGLADFSG